AVAGASPRELARTRTGLPSPMGCARLRRIVPSTCSDCPSIAGGVPYATPALHAVGPVRPTPPRHAPFPAWPGADEPVLASPFDEIVERLERIERELGRRSGAAPSPASTDGD